MGSDGKVNLSLNPICIICVWRIIQVRVIYAEEVSYRIKSWSECSLLQKTRNGVCVVERLNGVGGQSVIDLWMV